MIKQLQRTILLFMAFLLAAGLFGNNIPTDIQQSFQNGDAASLAKHFGNTVEITIDRKEQICSKMQAEIILKDFFQKYKPQTVKILHKGGGAASSYAILQLNCNDNTKFRITLLIKTVADKTVVQQLRIEPNDF